MNQPSFNLPTYLKALSVMVFSIVLVFLLIVGKGLLVPLFMGGFFAILFTPLCNWMEKNRIPRSLTGIFSLLLMIVLVAGLVSFIITNLVGFTNDFNNVSGRLNSIILQTDAWLSKNLGINEKLNEQFNTGAVLDYLNKNSSSISAFALNAIGSLSGLILIPVFMFFFLLYRDHLTTMMVKIYREKDPELVKMRIISLRKVIQNYLSGVAKVMVILAVLNISAYSIIGVDHAVFFGLLGAILNIIPYIGPLIGVMLPVSYAFLTMNSMIYPFLILGSYQVIQLIEGNYLTPKIVGGNVNLNAFITFLGLLIGGSIWGVAGMILAIPALAILREIFDLSDSTKPFALLMGEENKKEKNTPEPTDAQNEGQ
jgi:predicted PurR-regulated permease PerM